MIRWFSALLLLWAGVAQAQDELVIYTWEHYLAPEVKSRFEQETGIHVKEVNYDSDEARNRLLSGGYPPEFDIVFIDSLSLHDPVWQELFIPIPESARVRSDAIEPMFSSRCTNLAVPYMWGSIGIAYRSSLVTRPITQWKQILQPEAVLSGRIVMVDDTYDLVSVALKAAGFSINTHSRDELMAAYQLLRQQQPHVAEYQLSFAAIANSEVREKIAAMMVYSGDFNIVRQESEHNDWVYVVPEEGSPLWLDCITILKSSRHQNNARRFISFISRPEIALLNGKTMGFTPALKTDFLPDSIRSNPVSYPPPEQLRRSEFYNPDVSSNELRTTIYFSVLK